MLIDTHCHLNFDAFTVDTDDVIRRALNDNIWMILVGTDRKSSQKALDIANKYQSGVYAAVGLHPIYITGDQCEENEEVKTEEFSRDVYEKMATFEKVVAFGEIGLDYYRIDKLHNFETAKKKQQNIFIQQLVIAREAKLPVIIHCRQAHDDLVVILEKFRKENRHLFRANEPWGVIHCFSGNEDLAWKYFNLGLYISFTGIITFSKQWDDLIRRVPNDKFMIETDAPYLTPEPFRGKRNEPILVQYVADRIAEIKNLSLERVAELSTENAKILFKI